MRRPAPLPDPVPAQNSRRPKGSVKARLRPFVHAALAGLMLSACAAPTAQVSKNRLDSTSGLTPAPGLSLVPVTVAPVASQSNAALAGDFLDLTFQMESGRSLPVFSRFETPITVAMSGSVPASAGPDLTRLVGRLRSEAGINIQIARPGSDAAIQIDFHPRDTLRKLAPSAACFVVPGVSSLAEYRRKRGALALDWTQLDRRDRAAIFIPTDTSAQEIRDCLHEELAQAIGPLNDLYRLPDSVFNDDNFHTVLTAYDMTILRIYAHPDLASGMNREEVARRLPAILSQLNPGGGAVGAGGSGASSRAWADAIQIALSSRNTTDRRHAAAMRALAMSQSNGWTDTRAAFSHFALARIEAKRDPALAVTQYAQAARLWRGQPGTAIHLAHVSVQMASLSLQAGDPARALAFADEAMPGIEAAENAALRAMVLLIKAEALQRLGRSAEASRLRQDGRRWAQYGFTRDIDIEARVAEIAARSEGG